MAGLAQNPNFHEWKKMLLEKVYRQTDPVFRSLLERIARGEMTRAAFKYLVENCSAILHPEREAEFISEGIQYLCGTNKEVDSINEFPFRKKLSLFSVEEDRCSVKIPILRRSRPTNESVYLCLDAPIILEKNLNVAWGMTTGTEGIVAAVLYLQEEFPSDNLPAAVLVKFHDRPNPGFLSWIRESHHLLLESEYDSLSDFVPVSPEFISASPPREFPSSLTGAKRFIKVKLRLWKR